MSNSKLTPEQRAAINRANSQKSTGPKTQEGKEVSRLNGYRHGITGQATLMPEKDMNAYQKFTTKLAATYNPVGEDEVQFCQIVADSFWRLNRLRAIETNLLSLEFHEHQDAVNAKPEEAHVALTIACAVRGITGELAKLSIYEQRLNRMLHMNLTKLEQLQKARREKEAEEMQMACNIRAHAMAKGEPWDPTEDGFAFSLAQIDAASRRFEVRVNALVFAHPA